MEEYYIYISGDNHYNQGHHKHYIFSISNDDKITVSIIAESDQIYSNDLNNDETIKTYKFIKCDASLIVSKFNDKNCFFNFYKNSRLIPLTEEELFNILL